MRSRIQECRAHLFTWDVTTNFDKDLSAKELDDSFAREFPETCSRLLEGSPPGYFVLCPLTSFNASEGRVSRYLVAVVESQPANGSVRMLPEQIWRYALADSEIRKQSVNASNENNNEDDGENNSGNYLCYGTDGDAFYWMVFFEGRLCHWAEDNAWDKNRLERIRIFLKHDSLFSRAESFSEICLRGSFEDRLFKVASKDPFWRKINLRKEKRESGNGRGPCLRKNIYRGSALISVALLGLLLYGWWQPADRECANCIDAQPVELTPPPEWFEVIEMKELVKGENGGAPVAPCVLPEFRVNGLVAGKVAMLSLPESGLTPGKTSVLAVGGSLGDFKVVSVGRDRVTLQCRDSVVQKGVGENAP